MFNIFKSTGREENKMKKFSLLPCVVALLLLAFSSASAYNIEKNDGKEFSGTCDDGSLFTGRGDSSGWYTASGTGGTFFDQSMRVVISKACGE